MTSKLCAPAVEVTRVDRPPNSAYLRKNSILDLSETRQPSLLDLGQCSAPTQEGDQPNAHSCW